ncbi:ankyrin repeat domain-containing protein [Luteolibacter sp. GHJ8]|uniref:Ankyrin repeat domain-containing protein n=1 Tax=Luteolibacter rhizosphaerae TaxID=2989719 RepID=A0ABT3G143_9BACT|nr:ankyrin repeat domain-containing protein [Luteolibacter rhizosphaerae]MCW1913231.1 ankyrin repeat domain-containing protein [Luteolibacter rhizosphaerae]
MNCRPHARVALAAALLLAVPACRNPQREALKQLEKDKIEASGASLLQAVQDGDDKLVNLLLQARVYSGQRDAEGNSPLHVALSRGHVGIADRLISEGADLRVANPAGVTPVSLAVFKGESALADRLLNAGAPAEGLTPDGDKVLPWAIRNGRLVFVRRLMQGGADPHQKDAAGNPLLHVAIETGRRDLVSELLEQGADAGAVSGSGESSLVAALRKEWRDMLRPLAAAGADPNLPDSKGRLPLQAALDARDLPLAKLLVGLGARPLDGSWANALWKSYTARDLEVCGLLLGMGISPDTRDPQGRRPVQAALADGRADFLHLFLSYGADGSGLFYEASRRKAFHQTGIIVAHCGLPKPLPPPWLDTPLGLAIRHNDLRTVSLLLNRGASPMQSVAEGVEPLHLAIVLGRPRIVKELLKAGVDPNVALSLPVSAEFLRQVRGGNMRWLLKNDQNITPIMLAADSGHPSTARALLAAGAKTSVWTRRNRMWPINIAARKGDVKMMRVLLGKDPEVEQRRIVVDLSEQKAWIFDSSGYELFSTKVSTGRSGFATPTGTFAITNKYRDWTSTIYDASMPFFQRFSCGDFGFHQGVVPGYPASHGCIRVPHGNANKLFSLTELGDRVEIRP